MKVEEKMKKNINCELSHMIRPAGSLEVYKQKQNILFISESVEHRMFKVTWARLWVCSGVCMVEVLGRMHGGVLGRMHGPAVCDNGLDGRACRAYAYARPSARAYAQPGGP